MISLVMVPVIYLVVAIPSAVAYVWLRHRRKERPAISLVTAEGVPHFRVVWHQRVYESVDCVTWYKRPGIKTTSSRKARQLRKLVETYGWK